MNKHNKEVCAKMIIGAETGGQVYGAGRWSDVKKPEIGLEVTITLGAYQFYGNEGRQLLKMIFDWVDEHNLKLNNYANLRRFLDVDWVCTKLVPGKIDQYLISDLISSDIGRQMQTELFCNIQLPAYIKRAEEFGVHDDAAQMIWVEIEHVGGTKAAKRIFRRCDGDYSLDKIMWSLKQDQADHSSENQAGDKLFWSRHVFCRECIEKYATDEFDGVYVEVG
jgi:hypothetical protein